MKLLTIQQADKSPDPDIKLLAVRASRYRMFGSPERIQDKDLAVADLRGAVEPPDFGQRFEVLYRHQLWPIYLVKHVNSGG